MQEDDAMFLCKKQTACGVCEAILKYNTEPSLLVALFMQELLKLYALLSKTFLYSL